MLWIVWTLLRLSTRSEPWALTTVCYLLALSMRDFMRRHQQIEETTDVGTAHRRPHDDSFDWNQRSGSCCNALCWPELNRLLCWKGLEALRASRSFSEQVSKMCSSSEHVCKVLKIRVSKLGSIWGRLDLRDSQNHALTIGGKLISEKMVSKRYNNTGLVNVHNRLLALEVFQKSNVIYKLPVKLSNTVCFSPCMGVRFSKNAFSLKREG